MVSGVTIERGLAVPMRDGCHLATDVYRPTAGGPHPVLLMRLAGPRAEAGADTYAHPAELARRGYLVAVQEVRGRGDSEGDFAPFGQELADGEDALAWAATLPGGNGRIGMYGAGYAAATQVAAAMAGNPALRAIAPAMPRTAIVRGGPGGGGDEATWPAGWVERLATLDLPMFHLTGWNAASLGATMALFTACQTARQQRRGSRPLDDLDHTLVIGPWEDAAWGRHGGGIDHGSEARPDLDGMLRVWFDAWLHAGTRPDQPGGVRFFVCGERRWHSSLTWPPTRGRRDEWFLSSQGRANGCFGDGQLRRSMQNSPEDIVIPLPPPAEEAESLPVLAVEQASNRLLVYTAPALREPLTLCGRATCRLFLRGAAEGLFVRARLSLVRADGSVQELTRGTASPCRLPGDDASAAATVAQALTFDLHDFAWQAQPGDALRLDLGFPRTSLRAGASGPVLILHDLDHPALLELPVLM